MLRAKAASTQLGLAPFNPSLFKMEDSSEKWPRGKAPHISIMGGGYSVY
jgi:hypothetical protein